MKPVDFDYVRPGSSDEAVQLLGRHPGARVVAGGQTLGPMLNLRLARPQLLIDIARLAELTRVEMDDAWLAIGAGVTHAAIEDARFADPSRGFLPRVAAGIAYRAVRNRGTIGGSLAHADPAADWLTALLALDASLTIFGPNRRRAEDLEDFVTGAMTTGLGADEIITHVNIQPLSASAHWGYHKIARKTGDFADAIGAVVIDPERGIRRAVAGAVGGRPIVIERLPETADAAAWGQSLDAAGYKADAYDMQIHAAALARAHQEALQ